MSCTTRKSKTETRRRARKDDRLHKMLRRAELFLKLEMEKQLRGEVTGPWPEIFGYTLNMVYNPTSFDSFEWAKMMRAMAIFTPTKQRTNLFYFITGVTT